MIHIKAKRKLSNIQIAILWPVIPAILFVIFGCVFEGFLLRTIGFLSVAGLRFGAVSAISIVPSIFKYGLLWQMLISVPGCVLVAAFFHTGTQGFIMAVVIGLVLGYLARYWGAIQSTAVHLQTVIPSSGFMNPLSRTKQTNTLFGIEFQLQFRRENTS